MFHHPNKNLNDDFVKDTLMTVSIQKAQSTAMLSLKQSTSAWNSIFKAAKQSSGDEALLTKMYWMHIC